uniref:Acetoacetyl-CoA synthetase n=2 Tax=Macaca TaxID=9539 RepID=A0A5F8AET5_MACMU
MRKMGVKKGDRVVGYLPNSEHAVEAMLAAASIGAIWSSTSPDFGVNGVLDRFSQIQPKLIFSVEAVVYNGKEHSHMEKLQQVVKGLPDLKKVVVIPYVSSREKIDLSKIPNSVFLDDFLATGTSEQAPQLEFEQLPFSHPLFIMFSSGTTGAPKCMVHSAGGTLIQHLKEHLLHGNMTSSDILLCYTTASGLMATTAESTPRLGASSCLAGVTAHSTPTGCGLAARKSITSYTLNGKKVEVAVKQIIAGKAVEQGGAFSNPETLDLYRDIPELQGF